MFSPGAPHYNDLSAKIRHSVPLDVRNPRNSIRKLMMYILCCVFQFGYVQRVRSQQRRQKLPYIRGSVPPESRYLGNSVPPEICTSGSSYLRMFVPPEARTSGNQYLRTSVPPETVPMGIRTSGNPYPGKSLHWNSGLGSGAWDLIFRINVFCVGSKYLEKHFLSRASLFCQYDLTCATMNICSTSNITFRIY